MNILDKLNWRYATKEFDASKKISQEKLNIILKAANLTATSFGLQPGRVVLVENKEIREKLVQFSWGQKQVAESSHLLVLTVSNSVGDKDVDSYVNRISEIRNIDASSLDGMSKMVKGFLSGMDNSNMHLWTSNQAHIVLGNLLTVCAIENIDSCPIAGFQPEKYDELLGLEEIGQKSVLVLPIGYRLDSDKYSSLGKVRVEDESFVIKR